MRGALPGVIVLLALGPVACSPTRSLHVRGQLDRRTWVVRTCDAREAYRLMLTSDQAADLHTLETQLPASVSDTVVVEFDGYTIGPTWLWSAYETVGVRGPLGLQRASCGVTVP